MSTGLLRLLPALGNAWTTHSTWPVLSLGALVGLGCAVVHGARLARRAARERDARVAIAIGVALFAAALALRCILPERVHYTFNDEYEYVDHARRLLGTGEYRLWSGPPAGVYLYAAAFALFGTTSGVVFATTIVLASLTPPALYGALRVLGAERSLAALAAALLVVAPLHVKHAASASLEIASVLFLLLVLATFVGWLREPGWLSALGFAASLLFALTTRVENWALLALLPILALLWRREVRRPGAGELAVVVAAMLLAAAYLPGILEAPIRYDPWWKSRLPALSLLATNLAFWTGGDVAQRKLPVVVAAIGVVALLRSRPRVATFWLAFLLVYSVVFVAYGLNVGWVEEAHQPPPWGARTAGHDMFRFNVVLLPAVTVFLAGGVLAVVRAGIALARGSGAAATWPRGARMAALGAGVGVAGVLLLSFGEWRSYHPLAFVASPYNRSFEIAEHRFLRDELPALPEGSVCYALPPATDVVVPEVEIRPLEDLPEHRTAVGPRRRAYVYVNGRQLAVPRLADEFQIVVRTHRLREVAQRAVGRDRFYLFAVEG